MRRSASRHDRGANAVLKTIADDIESTTSCLFYSLAFLFQTPGVIKNAITKVTKDEDIFVYGISDKKVGGIDLQKPDGNVAAGEPRGAREERPGAVQDGAGRRGRQSHAPQVRRDRFRQADGSGLPGSYNFSSAADINNGENLLLITDRRVAVSYMVEALRIFDHYHFRVAQQESKKKKKKLMLVKPPKKAADKPWWSKYYSDRRKIRDRELFA